MNDLELYNEIGQNIKKKRKELGITQEKLAELTNYSLSFIANIESITYQCFSISALNNIAKALNTNMINLIPKNTLEITVEETFTCPNCDYPLPKEIIILLKSIKELTHKKIRLTCPICSKKFNF